MVGYDINDKYKLSPKQVACAGCLSSVCTRAFISPMDVIKIRMQLTTSNSASIPKTIKTLYYKEGVKAFWKGHVAAQCMGSMYGIIQLPIYEYLTEYTSKNLLKNTHCTACQSLICGGLAAGITQLIAQPVDTIRVRMVAQIGFNSKSGSDVYYNSFSDALKKICKSDAGVLDLWKGTIPAVTQIVPYAALTFFLVNLYQSIFSNALIYGFLGGSSAKLVTYPLDVLKKRLQVNSTDFKHSAGDYKYTSMRNCAITMFKNEGIKSFYKGATIAITKSGISSGIIFFTYKGFRRLISDTSDKYTLAMAERKCNQLNKVQLEKNKNSNSWH